MGRENFSSLRRHNGEERFCMKKFCFFLTLALLCAGVSFGQSGKKNALSVDAAPLLRGFVTSSDDPDSDFFGIGAFYERLIGSRYSLGVQFNYFSGDYDYGTSIDVNYLALSAHGRVYPLSQGLAKLYLDLGIGFNTIDVDLPNQKEEGGMTFALKAGYKHFFNDFIFVEPSIAYVYAKTITDAWPSIVSGPTKAHDPSPFEWTPGLLIGVSF
jgi:hypothetical protein